MNIKLIAYLLTLWLATLLASAQDIQNSATNGVAKLRELTPLEKQIAAFDANKNGRIEPAERQAYLAAQDKARQDFIKKWDENKDGRLDASERNRARAAWRKAVQEAKQAKEAEKTVATQLQTTKAPAP